MKMKTQRLVRKRASGKGTAHNQISHKVRTNISAKQKKKQFPSNYQMMHIVNVRPIIVLMNWLGGFLVSVQRRAHIHYINRRVADSA